MSNSLFERYGGFASVSKVVMSFYDKALDSEIIGDYFEDIDLPALIDHQTKFISAVMGGPASYTDKQLERVHAHLGIGHDAFDEVVSLLKDTLEEFEFDPGDVDQIIDQIRSRRPYIVKV